MATLSQEIRINWHLRIRPNVMAVPYDTASISPLSTKSFPCLYWNHKNGIELCQYVLSTSNLQRWRYIIAEYQLNDICQVLTWILRLCSMYHSNTQCHCHFMAWFMPTMMPIPLRLRVQLSPSSLSWAWSSQRFVYMVQSEPLDIQASCVLGSIGLDQAKRYICMRLAIGLRFIGSPAIMYTAWHIRLDNYLVMRISKDDKPDMVCLSSKLFALCNTDS